LTRRHMPRRSTRDCPLKRTSSAKEGGIFEEGEKCQKKNRFSAIRMKFGSEQRSDLDHRSQKEKGGWETSPARGRGDTGRKRERIGEHRRRRLQRRKRNSCQRWGGPGKKGKERKRACLTMLKGCSGNKKERQKKSESRHRGGVPLVVTDGGQKDAANATRSKKSASTNAVARKRA